MALFSIINLVTPDDQDFAVAPATPFSWANVEALHKGFCLIHMQLSSSGKTHNTILNTANKDIFNNEKNLTSLLAVLIS